MTVISHTPTDRLRVCTAMKKKHGVRESRRVKRSSASEFTGRFAGLGHAVEERDDGDPPRRGKRVFFCQALPRRGWVAPRRPGINKPTARPSPALGPAWPLPAEVSRMLERRRTPTSRRGARLPAPPSRFSACQSPKARRRGVASRSSAISADYAHARLRANLRRRSISDRSDQERPPEKSTKSIHSRNLNAFRESSGTDVKNILFSLEDICV